MNRTDIICIEYIVFILAVWGGVILVLASPGASQLPHNRAVRLMEEGKAKSDLITETRFEGSLQESASQLARSVSRPNDPVTAAIFENSRDLKAKGGAVAHRPTNVLSRGYWYFVFRGKGGPREIEGLTDIGNSTAEASLSRDTGVSPVETRRSNYPSVGSFEFGDRSHPRCSSRQADIAISKIIEIAHQDTKTLLEARMSYLQAGGDLSREFEMKANDGSSPPRKKAEARKSLARGEAAVDSSERHVEEPESFLLERELSSGHSVLGWLVAAMVFLGVMSLLVHLADLTMLITLLKHADFFWIAAAVACQVATYASAAAVWQVVIRRAGARLALSELLKLAVMELFANQAIPTGGLSGSLLFARGLVRRQVPSALAVTALLVAALSYYAAYFLMAAFAFALLWLDGRLTDAWRQLSIIFAVIIALIAVGLIAVIASKGRWIPGALKRRPTIFRLARALERVRTDIANDPKVLVATIFFQLTVFMLDATTLWLSLMALGVTIGPSPAFLAFVLASVVATVSPIPLGLGSFEGGCVAVLHLLGVGIEVGLAGTLIFRGLSFWLPMLPGLWLTRREVSGKI